MADLITITIDDKEVQVPEGELIVESVKRVQEEVPIFCYHPRLKPVGMCRMCLVEVGFKKEDGTVQKMPKPQAACTLPASKNMVVYTKTDSVIADRRGVLEFLLINHPLDCPICDKGGECPLQNNTLFYGPSTSRYVEMKRHLPKAFPLSKYVCLDLERCIQCARCTRFTEEISGDGQLAMLFRGAEMTPNTYQLTDFTSKFSGNTIEICPVGALTSQEYRFRARPWDLFAAKTICTGCSNGCNIWLDHRQGKLVRINGRTNEQVNDEWTCDKGKFGSKFLSAETRPGQTLLRRGERFEKATWSQAYDAVIEAFSAGQVACLGGAKGSIEDAYMCQKLFRRGFGTANLDHRMWRAANTPLTSPLASLGVHRMSRSIKELEEAKAIFVFGSQLSDEAPILFLRARKAWLQSGAKIVVATTERSDLDGFADAALRYKPGTEALLLSGLCELAAGRPLPAGIGETGVGEVSFRRTAEALSEPAILFGATIKTHLECNKLESLLVDLARATGGDLNYLQPDAGSVGATDMGLLPDALPGLRPAGQAGLDTAGILTAAAEGKLNALFLNGCDPLTEFPDRQLVERALERVPFLAVHHFVECEATEYASVLLPAQSWADRVCAFANVDGRVQRVEQALQPVGDAKPTWQMCAELLVRLEPSIPPFSVAEVMQEIAQAVPAYAGCTYDRLGEDGVRSTPLLSPGGEPLPV